jgi:hypothetical protein
MNLKCHYLERYPSLWDFRYVKETKEFLLFSNQVYQRNVKEVPNGILQTSYHSHANYLKLRKYDDSKSTYQRQYRSMIGSLYYVRTSIPDVMQAVGKVA